MSFEIVTVPCLSDNYAYLIHDEASGKTALVDVPEAAPILDALTTRDWSLSEVWITHHHADHVQGLAAVLAKHEAIVRGAAKDVHRLPALDVAHADEDHFDFAGQDVRVMDVSGHTIGHLAYYIESAKAVFTAGASSGRSPFGPNTAGKKSAWIRPRRRLASVTVSGPSRR